MDDFFAQTFGVLYAVDYNPEKGSKVFIKRHKEFVNMFLLPAFCCL